MYFHYLNPNRKQLSISIRAPKGYFARDSPSQLAEFQSVPLDESDHFQKKFAPVKGLKAFRGRISDCKLSNP
jgi:hypothetical protein